jgi:hypothetical protein
MTTDDVASTGADDPLALHYEFSQLSISDLLKARDTYHFHLMNKINVIGTAIGYYLIRTGDSTPEETAAGAPRPTARREARKFTNSQVRDYSWPCVLVLVSKWTYADEFVGGTGKYHQTQMVPKTLFLPDGQAVPVCVVEAEQSGQPENRDAPPPDVPPAGKLGGGMPITVTTQCVDYMATAGCLVTDGHYTYALTAGHVCGDEGTPVSSQIRGRALEVGKSSGKRLTQVPFSTAYPDFPGRRSYSALDAGLIKLDDLTLWTSNIYGLPPLKEMADVHEHNLSLRLIDRRVLGYGAASGLVRGTIKALFYRYKSVGGFDYIADFLISPGGDSSPDKDGRPGKGSGTRHGDSGMIWNLDVTEDPASGPATPLKDRQLKPLAVQWGGQMFTGADQRCGFAVAASLTNVCRLLDIELVNTLSSGVSGYWGRVGHYSIAAFAVQLVADTALKAFLQANIDLLSFDLSVIGDGKTLEDTIADLGKGEKFMPLADVPDEIWKKMPPPGKRSRIGGRDDRVTPFGSNGPEHPNHYADIDDLLPDGQTWRQKCLADDANITVAAWKDFYAQMVARCQANHEKQLADQYGDPLRQGLLPLRVWQIFDVMVQSVTSQNLVDFLTAAGVCAHYVGDASQPLHGSLLADGDPRQLGNRTDPKTGRRLPFGDGVHSPYESDMLTHKAGELIDLINEKLQAPHDLALCRNGQGAARATLELMDKVAQILPPIKILTSFENHGAAQRVATYDGMWDDLGTDTAEVMLRGAETLAMIWDASWQLGKGAAIAPSELVAVNSDAVRLRYIDNTFVPSCTLDEIEPLLG